MFIRRPGGQSQFAAPTWLAQAPPGPIRQAQQLVVTDPGGDHRIAVLAGHVGMSERHFIRRFSAEVGMPAAKYVTEVRVNAARHALESGTDTTASIAGRCGFGTAETMRRAFVARLGVPPDAYRQRFARSARHRSPKARTSITPSPTTRKVPTP
jgi:transcriptional regulator GlxA family with amidase domain